MKAGDAAGCLGEGGYLQIRVDSKQYNTHRIAHLLMTRSWPNGNPEHENQIKIDNRWSNIKDLAPPHDNSGNKGLQINNTSGLRGVSWRRWNKRWQVHIYIHGKSINLGCFDNKDEAGLVWDAAARLAWTPRFQRLNHPRITAHHITLSDLALRQIEAAMTSQAVEQALAEAA
jgi:hypothetical protein